MAPMAFPRPFGVLKAFSALLGGAAFHALALGPLFPSPIGTTPDPLRAQDVSPTQESDRRAREAQNDFESLRQRRLPAGSHWGPDPCQASAGRMCWRYDRTLVWRPEAEDPEVTAARETLLDELEGASAVAPGSDWILGQRVRYLLEAGRSGEAGAVAQDCGAVTPWWCRALEGLVLHLQGKYLESEGAFDDALHLMDPGTAAEWENPDPLLERDEQRALRDALGAPQNEEEKKERSRRIWDLSDPLLILPGNDRRTEHLARHVYIELFADAATPHRLSWGADRGELLLRYGRELGWERVRPRPGGFPGQEEIIGFEHPDVRRFLPPAAVISNPTGHQKEAWAPAISPSARSGYAPAYAPILLPMSSRILVFTRGDYALVAATFRLPADTTFRTREGLRGAHSPPEALQDWPIRAGLVMDGPGESPPLASLLDGEAHGLLSVEVPSGDYRASVEIVDPASGVAGRYRNGIRIPEVPPDVLVLSDLILMDGEVLPSSTSDALARIRLDDRIAPGETLVAGWEIWGLGWREEAVDYNLTLERADPGLLERLRRLFGGRKRYTNLQWQEWGPGSPGAAFQSVSITVPDLSPGRYRLGLELRARNRTPLSKHVILEVAETEAAR